MQIFCCSLAIKIKQNILSMHIFDFIEFTFSNKIDEQSYYNNKALLNQIHHFQFKMDSK